MIPASRNSFQTPSRMFEDTPKPFADQYWRRCLRVMRMVGILHGKGFQGLRVFPWHHPAGHRMEIFPARYVELDGVKVNYDRVPGGMDSPLIARHSGAQAEHVFEWPDAGGLDAQALALLFIRRFPELCAQAFHLDYAYAGWFATLLTHCEYGYMPYLFGEYQEKEMGAFRMHKVTDTATHEMEWFPLPPSSSYGSYLSPMPQPRWLATDDQNS